MATRFRSNVRWNPSGGASRGRDCAAGDRQPDGPLCATPARVKRDVARRLVTATAVGVFWPGERLRRSVSWPEAEASRVIVPATRTSFPPCYLSGT
jgi:hypothetical protein